MENISGRKQSSRKIYLICILYFIQNKINDMVIKPSLLSRHIINFFVVSFDPGNQKKHLCAKIINYFLHIAHNLRPDWAIYNNFENEMIKTL